MNHKKIIKEKFRELLADPENKKFTIDMPIKSYNIHPFKILFNKLIILLSRKIIPSGFKNWLVRLTGLKIGRDVCLPNDIIFDPYFPELIEVKDGALVGSPSKLMAHEYKDNKLTIGKVIVEKRVLVGGFSYLGPGAVINENSILNLGSELHSEVPPGELWGGKPAKTLKKFTEEELEKYFKPSDGKYREYYSDFNKKVREFQKNKDVNFIKFHYNGKRLNAGDDWWRARNVFRILYNGVIIETTKIMGPSPLKTFLLRMAGAKIGKNVMIKRGVTFDHIYPDTITVEDNVVIGEDSEIAGHEYTTTQTVFGRVLIKKNAVIKEHVLIRTGTTIGENSIIEPYSFAQKEIPANEVWGGSPTQFVKKAV
ncbi:MAG: hypothetical protein Q7J54_00985 [Candidatus Woesearchaeota archaeon]|nr:hypothetical protein [Candidatus Woesearchaeota archaeon]